MEHPIPKLTSFVDLSAEQIREVIAQHPEKPYETLDTESRHDGGSATQVVENLLANGWSMSNDSIPSVRPPIQWDGHTRSFMFHLHAWEPVNVLLRGYSLTGKESYFDSAMEMAKEWIDIEVAPFLPTLMEGTEKERETLLHRFSTDDHMFRWYDMGVGQRIYRIAFILDHLARSSRTDDATLVLFYRALMTHFLVLARDRIFRANTNHGAIQAVGQLAAAQRFQYLPGVEPYLAQAWQRTRDTLAHQFFPSGCHREHSAGYQFMILNLYINARNSGLIDDEDVVRTIDAAEEVLSWMIQPNGVLAAIGDTDQRDLARGENFAKRYKNTQLQNIFSGGKIGDSPRAGTLALTDEGYFFARGNRDGWWYLAQLAGFHSRVHKQADDLSFIWSDRGTEILVDAGRYGYAGKTPRGSALFKEGFWYSDPKRVYVESTRSHNAVEIDGKSYARKRVPYGSALKYGGEQGELIVTECDVHHFRTVRHWRSLVLKPGHFLLVFDWLFDRSGAQHDFRPHFQIADCWKAGATSRGSVEFLNRDGMSMTMLELVNGKRKPTVVKGQEEPELQGWRSIVPYQLIPATTVRMERLDTDFAVFATLFTFGREARACPELTKAPRSLRPAALTWREENRQLSLHLFRHPGDAHVTADFQEKEIEMPAA